MRHLALSVVGFLGAAAGAWSCSGFSAAESECGDLAACAGEGGVGDSGGHDGTAVIPL